MKTQFLIIIFLGVALYQLIYMKIDKLPKRVSRIFYIAAFLCLIPGALIPFYYTHFLDNQTWYYEYRSIQYIEYSLVMMAPLFAVFAVKFKRFQIVFLLAFISLTAVPYIKYFLTPLNTALLKNRVVNGITMQSVSGTCGPSAIAALLRRHGIEKSERELAELCHTTQSGTEIWYIKRYLNTLGVDSEFIIDENTSPLCPSIAGTIVQGTFGHFISVLNCDKGIYTIGDSMLGELRIPAKNVRQKIYFTGFYLKIKLKSGEIR